MRGFCNGRSETQAYSRTKAEEILAASTAIPRLRKEIEAAQQEAATLEGVRREASLKAASSRLEQGKVSGTGSCMTYLTGRWASQLYKL